MKIYANGVERTEYDGERTAGSSQAPGAGFGHHYHCGISMMPQCIPDICD